MDQSERPTTYRQLRPLQERRRHPGFNAFLALSVTVLGFAALTTAASGPSFGPVAAVANAVIPASLSFTGPDLVITGSVQSLFSSPGTFTGPNRNEKQNRARIIPDALEFADGFNEARVQLASLRAGAFGVPGPVGTAVAAVAPIPAAAPAAAAPAIQVAALGPTSASSALDAIQTVAPAGLGPVPVVLSEELAYARADAPVTRFDGVALDSSGQVVSEKELWCLAQAIYFEARGESYDGQVAVAQVVLNRVKHRLYPDTICGVVFQNQQMRNACQFSFACDGVPERIYDQKSWIQAEQIANGVVGGKLHLEKVGKATHYHATYVYPHWAPKMKKVTKVGLHVFYQFKRNWRFG